MLKISWFYGHCSKLLLWLEHDKIKRRIVMFGERHKSGLNVVCSPGRPVADWLSSVGTQWQIFWLQDELCSLKICQHGKSWNLVALLTKLKSSYTEDLKTF